MRSLIVREMMSSMILLMLIRLNKHNSKMTKINRKMTLRTSSVNSMIELMGKRILKMKKTNQMINKFNSKMTN